MNFKEIAKGITGSQRKSIQDALIKNTHHVRNFTQHHRDSIILFFSEWHKIFPTNKQDVNCSSCRNAVVKFWNEVNLEWSEEKITKKTKSKNKKSTTRTGAIAKGVGVTK